MKVNELLKYRSAWIGLAMLWIVLTHSGFELPGRVLPFLKETGYGGVDICLFASGIGCCHSLERDPDILRFLKRRAVKLLPVYWLFIPVWLLLRALTGELTPLAAVGNILGVQSLTGLGGEFNWYIGALIVVYLLAPAAKAVADRCGQPAAHLGVLLLLCAFSVPFWGADHLLIIAARLPVFYAGMAAGKLALAGYTLVRRDYMLLGAAAVAGTAALILSRLLFPQLLWTCGMHWYPFLLITPGLCAAISVVMKKVAKAPIVASVLSAVAERSFGLYLTHLLVFEVTHRVLHSNPSLSGTLLWTAAFVISFPAAAGLCRLARLLSKTPRLK